MNASYERNGRFDSNSRIFEGYYTESAPRASKLRNALESICASEKARTLFATLRVFGTALSLVGFVGVIGAMENGSLSLLNGLLLGSLLLSVEYLCLRRRRS